MWLTHRADEMHEGWERRDPLPLRTQEAGGNACQLTSLPTAMTSDSATLGR